MDTIWKRNGCQLARRIAAIAAVLTVLGLTNVARGAGLQFNDPNAPSQYYLTQLRFNEAWEVIQDLPQRGSVTVAVIDSGFQTDHTDLGNNLSGGINIVDNSQNLAPVHPHGTATAGLPGSISGNNFGISQSALFADVMPIRVSNRNDGGAFISDIAKAIVYAADNNARVINISYSGVDNPTLELAAQYAWGKGSVVFMAAGNDGLKHNEWADHPHLIAVGATGPTGQLAGFSTRGKFVDLVAPGQAITTLYTSNQIASWSGTSFSSPIAASVAALMLTANPDLSPEQVDNLLQWTAVDPAGAVKDKRSRLNERIRKVKNPLRKAVLREQVKRLSNRITTIAEFWGAGRIDALAAVEAALRVDGAWAGGSTVPNDPGDFIGLVAGLSQGAGDPLVLPQGFLEPASVSSIPEPGTILLSLAGLAMVLHRKPRRPRV